MRVTTPSKAVVASTATSAGPETQSATTRILLPDLLGRVAALIIVGAVAISLLAPLTAGSATPLSVESMRLLAAADQPLSAAARATGSGRERSAGLSLAAVTLPIWPETVGDSPALATPPSIAMEATLYRRTSSVASVAPPMSGDTLTGKATWYCCTLGWGGQAVVALPGALGGHYDSPPAAHFVTICADRCAVLPVADYCDCYWGTDSQKVADLSPEAWAAVTDSSLSRGVVTVTVQFSG